MTTKKLCIYPNHVWEDIQKYIWDKYKLTTPRYSFKISTFIYSKKFDYKKFIANITEKQSMKLFVLVCKKLGIGFIQDSNGWKIICLEETADELMVFIEQHMNYIEEVKVSQTIKN